MITAAMPPVSAIQTTASKSFLFMETSYAFLPARLPESAGTSVTAITFRAY
jgi:hypothetical protein